MKLGLQYLWRHRGGGLDGDDAAIKAPPCSDPKLHQITGVPLEECMEIRLQGDAPASRIRRGWIALGWLAAFGCGEAATFPLPPDGQVLVGQLQETRIKPEETLSDIARRFGVGVNELKNANPGVDPWLPSVGQRVVIPSQYLLPNVPHEGIVVNLPELRLYYFPPAAAGERRMVMIYPLGIGSEGRVIPLGVTQVLAKKIDPPWVVPDSILAEHEAEGRPLPKVVPPGPDNPLGRYALRLGFSSFLIHSTNHPYSVGLRISHGCLRMYPENIEELFGKVDVGTPVRIIDQPYKAGWQGNELYLEAHPPLVEAGHTPNSNLTPMVTAVAAVVTNRLDDYAWQAAVRVATQGDGIPAPIFVRATDIARRSRSDGRPALDSKQAWMVQVGIFRNRGGAERVAQMLRRLELPVVASMADEGRPCRVLVGPFDSRATAARTGDQIYKDTGLRNLLVPASQNYGSACRPTN